MATLSFLDPRSPTNHYFGKEGGEETKSSFGVYSRFEDRNKVRFSSQREGLRKEEGESFRIDKIRGVKKNNNEYNRKV